MTAEVEHEEDATGNELSKLFLLRRGGMANDEGKQTQKDKAKGAQHSAFEAKQTNKRPKSSKGKSKQATRAKLHGNGLNARAQRDHLLTTGNLPVNYDY